jgi:hypothetical protein
MQLGQSDGRLPASMCSCGEFRAAELFKSSISIPAGSDPLYAFVVGNQKEPGEIAAFVRSARKAMGLTLEAFGERFGRTKANVHGWENDKHEPAYAVLAAIAEA